MRVKCRIIVLDDDEDPEDFDPYLDEEYQGPVRKVVVND